MLKKVLLGMLVATGVHAQTVTNHWPQMAQTDLDFVYRTLQENHPGALDKENPYFKDWMERGYAAASASARQARSLADEKRLLSRYMAGFADGHLQIGYNVAARAMRWPGIIVGRTGSRYLITGRAPQWPAPLPALGAELVSCDGRAPDALMNQDILPAVFNLTSSDAVKNIFMYYLMLDDDQTPHQYARCTFSDAGAAKEFPLEWTGIERIDYLAQWRAANPQVSRHSTIAQVAPKTWWVHLPDFTPGAEQEAELKKVIAQMPELRTAALVIFDTRGNHGGDSQWGESVLEGLYGKPYTDYLRQKQDNQSYAEWRVSKGNFDHLAVIIERRARQFKSAPGEENEFTALYARMAKALENGTPFVRQTLAAPGPHAPAVAHKPLSTARAILVTDSDCASACLDFADVVLLLPGARHFGQTTGADTLFMDIRYVDLPSQLGTLAFAQKVYRGRQRANNQPWVPSLQYPGQIADTGKLKAWVLEQTR